MDGMPVDVWPDRDAISVMQVEGTRVELVAQPDAVHSITLEEDATPTPPGATDTPAPPEWYRYYHRGWDDKPQEAVAAVGAGAWKVLTKPPPSLQHMPQVYAMAKEVLEAGRSTCVPQQVSVVLKQLICCVLLCGRG